MQNAPLTLEQIQNRLRSVQLFRNLGEDLLKSLAEMAEYVVFPNGTKIVKEGDPSNEFYCILGGFVNITKNSPDTGKEVFITTIGEGDCFGEAGAFIPLPRTANVIANSSVETVKFTRNNFLTFLKRNPQAGLLVCIDVIQQLFIRLRDTSKELEFERRGSASQEDIDELFKNL